MIKAHIREVLIVTGVLTMPGITLFLVPRTMLKLVFGEPVPDQVTTTIARHWGLLLFLIGGLLVFAGYHPELRVPVMIVGAIEKFLIAALVFASRLRARRLLDVLVGADAVMGILYVIALS